LLTGFFASQICSEWFGSVVIELNQKVLDVNPKISALNPEIKAVNPKILATYPRVDTRRQFPTRVYILFFPTHPKKE
jgi:hypothetical protein